MTKYKKQNGFAAIVIVFVLGLVALLIAVTLINNGYLESINARAFPDSAKAFYYANAGIEDAVYRINSDPSLGNGSSYTYEFDIGNGKVQITITGDEDNRQVEAVGYYNKYIRRIEAEFVDTSLPGDAFIRAVHAGAEGLEMQGNTLVTSLDGSGGNVYSNSFIKGKSNGYNIDGSCKNSASAINGTAWAVTQIDKLTPGNGVCIVNDAYAEVLNYCYVNGDVYSPTSPGPGCPIAGIWTNQPAPTPIPLPEFGEDNLKSYLTAKGNVFTGNCVIGGTPDCTSGTNTLGEIIIDGNLTVLSNNTLTVDGPIWVKQNLLFNSNVIVDIDSSVGTLSQLVVADGTIVSDSDVEFGVNIVGTEKAFLLFLSTHAPTSLPICDNPSIQLSSNTNSVLFYAKHGCILINSNSDFQGAVLGEGIRIESNSAINYDPDLQFAIFALSKEGGWQIISFKEN